MAYDEPDRTTPVFTSGSRLKIAPFAFNMQRGGTPTLGEGSLASMRWDQQMRIAQLAESANCEAIIPAARWRGYEGPSQWSRESYETLPWAAGLAAVTSKVMVFSTVHVPLYHPVQAAKLAATVDHISGGRFALNIVSGWNVDEFEMFDYQQREHDDRYAVSTEWVTLLKRLWAEDQEFDFDGQYYRSPRTYSAPRPVQSPRPLIMSAGSSPAGRQFAATQADICFAVGANLEKLAETARDIKDRAARAEREVQVWTSLSMLCEETEADAKRQYDYFVHQTGDWQAAEHSLRQIMRGQGQSMDWKISDSMKESRVRGAMGPALVGSPEMIVETMTQLCDAGIDGVATVWFDYERGIEAFRDLVQPLAASAGIRKG